PRFPSPEHSPNYFGGLVDELTIYSHALSAEEVASIFNAGSAGKCRADACVALPPGCIGWWPSPGSGIDLISRRPAFGVSVNYSGPGLAGHGFLFERDSSHLFFGNVNMGNFGTEDFSI